MYKLNFTTFNLQMASSLNRNNDLKVDVVCALYLALAIILNNFFEVKKTNIVIASSLNTI